MLITKTARQKLRNYTRYLQFTLDRYRDALEYINKVVYREWSTINALPAATERLNHIEKLVHSTAKNMAACDFDSRFYKFPSYFRRAVIAESLGHVSSHMERYGKWTQDLKGRPPAFNPACNAFPVFYRDNMSAWISNGKLALKLYNGTDWICFILPFEPIKPKRFPLSEGWVRMNPALVLKNKRWYLHIPFQKQILFSEKDLKRPVLSVDLGLNCIAVASVISSGGTVMHRAFIDYGREKDHLKTVIGRIAVKGARTWIIPGNQRFCKRLWDTTRNLTGAMAHQCSHELVEIALRHNCQTIVFEHLGRLRIPKGIYGAARKRRKFHYFLRGRIQKNTRYKAASCGIRFSRVLAGGTSENAYDGSGKVRRVGNRQVALFRNEKWYNSDLSASYNIGARYWIRELFPKSLTGNSKVAGEGQSPCPVARHQQTLASFISLVRSASPGGNASHVPYSGQGSSLMETAITATA